MADIFLSYVRSDAERAKRVADALEAKGWSVWWDVSLVAGDRFRSKIAEQLHSARCVVVLWSATSIESDWVIDEAEDGKKRRILVQALIENVVPPHGFRQIHAARLIEWNGSDSGEFARLCEGISAHAPLSASAITRVTDSEGSAVAPSSPPAMEVTAGVQSRQTDTTETLMHAGAARRSIRNQFLNHWRMALSVAVLIASVLIVAQLWREDSTPASVNGTVATKPSSTASSQSLAVNKPSTVDTGSEVLLIRDCLLSPDSFQLPGSTVLSVMLASSAPSGIVTTISYRLSSDNSVYFVLDDGFLVKTLEETVHIDGGRVRDHRRELKLADDPQAPHGDQPPFPRLTVTAGSGSGSTLCSRVLRVG